MARPRGFGDGAVLDIVVSQFRTRGFEATSMRDLDRARGVTAASFNNAFGDQRVLSRRAFDRDVEARFTDRVGGFEGRLPPREAISASVADVGERSRADEDRKGCTLVNSALAVAPHDPEFQRVVAAVRVRVAALFRRCIAAGQAAGTIARPRRADDLDRMLPGMLLGRRVLARSRPGRGSARRHGPARCGEPCAMTDRAPPDPRSPTRAAGSIGTVEAMPRPPVAARPVSGTRRRDPALAVVLGVTTLAASGRATGGAESDRLVHACTDGFPLRAFEDETPGALAGRSLLMVPVPADAARDPRRGSR